jgi:hypothetical protein
MWFMARNSAMPQRWAANIGRTVANDRTAAGIALLQARGPSINPAVLHDRL